MSEVFTAQQAAQALNVPRGRLYYALTRYSNRRFPKHVVRLVTLDECRAALAQVTPQRRSIDCVAQ